MIKLTRNIPQLEIVDAAYIKIRCLFKAYSDDSSVLFWEQNGGNAFISMTDGNMIIYNASGDTDELSEFVAVLSPVCIFSDYNTLEKLGRLPDEKICVMHRKADEKWKTDGDELTSREIYSLLDVDGLSLPDYPAFAVDYCRRLNRGTADYFAIKDKCAAITFNSGKVAIMNGIASHGKGFGTVALKAVLGKNFGRDFLVCCRNSVKGFYEKSGFKELYYAGYWVKSK